MCTLRLRSWTATVMFIINLFFDIWSSHFSCLYYASKQPIIPTLFSPNLWPKETFISLFKESGNIIWGLQYVLDQRAIEKVQLRATKLICELHFPDDHLTALNLLSLYYQCLKVISNSNTMLCIISWYSRPALLHNYLGISSAIMSLISTTRGHYLIKPTALTSVPKGKFLFSDKYWSSEQFAWSGHQCSHN